LQPATHTECVMDNATASPTSTNSSTWHHAQAMWSSLPITQRLMVLKAARHIMASQANKFAAAISPELARTPADTLIAEVLPLLDACKFLEREAESILATRSLGRRGLPLWLAGVKSEVRRAPLGKVLVIGPANYPLFLPGVQTLQALAAGNAVVWKPGHGGKAVADLFAAAMYAAGLPQDLLRVADDSTEATYAELDAKADIVVFTGSAKAGSAVLNQLAYVATPAVMELSGCDAVIALPSVDLAKLEKALAFGLRFNGSATCMAPRRLFVLGASREATNAMIERIFAALGQIEGCSLAESTRHRLANLLEDARDAGAVLRGKLEQNQRPILVTNATPTMGIARTDIFAPVLTLMEVRDEAELLVAMDDCPYALTTAIFGDEREAQQLAEKITAGTVLINDLIVPTADPRVPFGGRRQSGFGVTRGREGLLEMTAVKVVSVRRSASQKHYEPTTADHEHLFDGLIKAAHTDDWRTRWTGVKELLRAACKLRTKQ
jgi:acyl-CoA reductase-like NAD-dependent aldehyde dehydrogenase